jgi:trk system potassium uptake protein TrkA
VYHASGLDPDFIERERIGRAHAAIFAMREDSKNHYAATLAKVHDFSTVVMTVLMWLGRLEVIPIVVLLTRRYWRV